MSCTLRIKLALPDTIQVDLLVCITYFFKKKKKGWMVLAGTDLSRS